MLFSSIPFLYYFLPAVVMLYFLVPSKAKNAFLLLSSLLFYAWGEQKYFALMMFSIVAYYGFGLAIQYSNRKKLWLSLAVATGVGMLLIFKYLDFFMGSFTALLGLSPIAWKLALPIGISFYTFQCISYCIDVYRGDTQAQNNLLDFGTYVALFPQLIAGPIVRYVDVQSQLLQRSHSIENITEGLPRFLIGLGKKVILANNLALPVAYYRDSPAPTVLFAWLYAIAFTLHIYFDFSGYSDMAIGLGRIFGFHFPENFRHPYVSGSITEFWRRWHMTLGQWFRDYVYIPLGGNRVGKGRWILNLLAVWMLTGLWHGAAWNFVAWGLLFALLLLLEKNFPVLTRLPSVLKAVYVMGIVTISFVIFNAEGLTQAVRDLSAMFGLAGLPLYNRESLYYLTSFAPLLLISAVGATPLLSHLQQWLPKTAAAAGSCLALLAILLVCTAYLVDGSFNPFLYFRF